MIKHRTIAEIAVGQEFFMDIGSSKDTLCKKISSDNKLIVTRENGTQYEVQGRPLWGHCKNHYEMREQQRSKERKYRPVTGHSATWPYGEH